MKQSIRPADLFTRSPHNPILSAANWPVPVEGVFNPGATVVNGEVVLLCRITDRQGLSYLQVARSKDGETNWKIDPQPLIFPNSADPKEQWGVEDPRITWVDELKKWIIVYTIYGPSGPTIALAGTTDFVTVEKYGAVFPPEDKDAALFPRKIGGKFILVHRPVNFALGSRADIRISRSEDLLLWSESEPVLRSRIGPWWDSARVGIGPQPIETPIGWLMFYHGVKSMVNGAVYRLGAVILDKNDPTKVLRRDSEWLLGPEAPYELEGNVPNVVFPSGVVVDEANDTIRLYYGAADTSIGMASARLSEVMKYLQVCKVPAESEPEVTR